MAEQRWISVDADYLKELEEKAKKVDYYQGIIDGITMCKDILNWAVETFGSNTEAEPEPEPQAEPPAEVKKPERKKPRTKATKKPGARKELDMGKITALPTIRKALRDLEYPDLTDGMFD